MPNNNLKWLHWISEIHAIAQNGLTYSRDEYDKERYHRLQEIAAELATECSTNSLTDMTQLFSFEKGYITPKLDVRSFVLQDDKLLLVKERSDGLWTLPGGFADVNESPAEAVVRETQEESGFNVSAVKLLALWDKLKHDHPPQWPHTYKIFFHCKILSGEKKENLEISEIGFFDLHHLPPLSTHRVTAKQITRLYEAVLSDSDTLFD